jgi:hypothetical protein
MYIADAQAGSGCAQKINAAITASSGKGTIQVGAGCGSTITATVNPSGLPVAIQFVSAGTWTQSAPIIIGANGGSISGISAAELPGPITLQAAESYIGTCPADTAGTTYSALICMQPGSSIHDITIDGNKESQSGTVHNILVQNAGSIKIRDATIQNSLTDNIHVTNTFYPTVTSGETLALGAVVYLYATDTGSYLYTVTVGGTGTSLYPSCSPTLNANCTWGGVTLKNIGSTYDGYSSNGWIGPNVLLKYGGRYNMFAERVNDWTVAGNVQFELAGSDGFHCEDCGAFRFTQDDFGANGGYGYKAIVVNGQCNTTKATEATMITGGTQFGGNVSGDIYINGTAETRQPASGGSNFCVSNPDTQFAGAYTIVGNQFIAPSVTGLNSIQFVDAGANVVAGNTWGATLYSLQYLNLVKTGFSTIASYAQQPSVVTSNSWMLNIETLPPYSAGAPYSLTSGIDVGDYLSANGTVTEYGNRVTTGNHQVTGMLTYGTAPALKLGQIADSATSPTISSGFGTSASMAGNNGTAAFTVYVGAGGTASSGVIGLPAATNYWSCTCNDSTSFSTTVFMCRQTATTVTSVSISNVSNLGVVSPWNSGDYLLVNCRAQ